jgi:hypothetical protein
LVAVIIMFSSSWLCSHVNLSSFYFWLGMKFNLIMSCNNLHTLSTWSFARLSRLI